MGRKKGFVYNPKELVREITTTIELLDLISKISNEHPFNPINELRIEFRNKIEELLLIETNETNRKELLLYRELIKDDWKKLNI